MESISGLMVKIDNLIAWAPDTASATWYALCEMNMGMANRVEFFWPYFVRNQRVGRKLHRLYLSISGDTGPEMTACRTRLLSLRHTDGNVTRLHCSCALTLLYNRQAIRPPVCSFSLSRCCGVDL